MHLRNINFDEDGDPTKVTFEMSVAEAIGICVLVGSQTGPDLEKHDLDQGVNEEVYSAMVGEFFNRFWEDGVSEAKRNYPS